MAVVVGGAVLLGRSGPQPGRGASASTVSTETSDSPRSVTSQPVAQSTSMQPLASPDLTAGCMQEFGTGAVLNTDGGVLGYRCVGADGVAHPIDISRVCQLEFGESSRGILIREPDGGWRCAPVQRSPQGSPDWAIGCRSLFGSDSVATMLAHDADGWRCADIVKGIFAVHTISADEVCQATYGRDVFGEKLNATPSGISCFVASAR